MKAERQGGLYLSAASTDSIPDKKIRRLNLAAIEAALVMLQAEFPRINAELSDKRDALTDKVVENILEGYRCVDDYLSRDIDLFQLGNSKRLLHLNRLVLYGQNKKQIMNSERPLMTTSRHFYEAKGGGIGTVMEWLETHQKASVWKRAAGVFTHVLSQPQLFIEGNHRTGALIMSYLLAREGQPPFVLTVDNARHFFNPATLVKKSRKHGLDSLLKLPKLTKRFARFLEDQGDEIYLL
jgi:hypothetical protein